MRFIIMGYDKRYSSKHRAEEYANFDNRADCYRYLNKLRTGCLADTTSFFVKEEFGNGTDKDSQHRSGNLQQR